MNARGRLGQMALAHRVPSKASTRTGASAYNAAGEFPGAAEAVSADLCRPADLIQVVEEVTSPRKHYPAFGRALDRVVSEIRYDRLW